MKCFHHNDLDGRCAAAIVKYARQGMVSSNFIEMDYKDPFPFGKIEKDEKVYIVDFSLKPNVMNKLLEITETIIWIDHHKTAIEYEPLYNKDIHGYRNGIEKGPSGCELTWRHIFPGQEMPRAVQLVGDRDSWRWEFGDETKHFNLGLEIQDTSPCSDVWVTLIEEGNTIRGEGFLYHVINDGKTCLAFRDNFCKDYIKSYGWEIIFEGHKCFACGIYRFGSEKFGDLIDKYDICLSFEYLGSNWIVGLYSKTVDVSRIAKKYGGGGHVGAAGFTSDSLPF